jgi:hypothetical protein
MDNDIKIEEIELFCIVFSKYIHTVIIYMYIS